MRFAIFLGLLLATATACAAESVPPQEFEIGPWRLNMSRGQVQSFSEFGPYKLVELTDGLETQNGVLFEKRATTSFVFDPAGLQYIQVWKYEGNNAEDAQEAVVEIFKLFSSQLGGAEIENVNVTGPDGGGLSEPALRVLLGRILGTAKELTDKFRKEMDIETLMMFDMKPNNQPLNSRIHSQWGYNSRTDTFYVFLFQDRMDAAPRHIDANIRTEKR